MLAQLVTPREASCNKTRVLWFGDQESSEEVELSDACIIVRLKQAEDSEATGRFEAQASFEYDVSQLKVGTLLIILQGCTLWWHHNVLPVKSLPEKEDSGLYLI